MVLHIVVCCIVTWCSILLHGVIQCCMLTASFVCNLNKTSTTEVYYDYQIATTSFVDEHCMTNSWVHILSIQYIIHTLIKNTALQYDTEKHRKI
jgi:hypothetical protein